MLLRTKLKWLSIPLTEKNSDKVHTWWKLYHEKSPSACSRNYVQLCPRTHQSDSESFPGFWGDVSWYQAGHEDDGKRNNGNYDCKFTAEVHDSVMKLMKEDPETIPKYTRICFGRVWSDGFEAHHVVAKNGYSSLQLFTLSLVNSNHRITKCNTWPCALCFKKDNSPEIFCHILEEIHTLRKPAFRYWGRDK